MWQLLQPKTTGAPLEMIIYKFEKLMAAHTEDLPETPGNTASSQGHVW